MPHESPQVMDGLFPRSSNAACGFPALRSPTGFIAGIRRLGNMSVLHAPIPPWRRDTACSEGSWLCRCLVGLRQFTNRHLLRQAHQKSGSFPPPALPGFIGRTTLSDSRADRRPIASLRPLPSPDTGLPQLPGPPFQHAVPTTPMDRNGCVCRLLPRPLGPSPFLRRVGVHHFTFGACSGFTRVTACWIARPPKAVFVTRLQSSWLPNQTAVMSVFKGYECGIPPRRFPPVASSDAGMRGGGRALSDG